MNRMSLVTKWLLVMLAALFASVPSFAQTASVPKLKGPIAPMLTQKQSSGDCSCNGTSASGQSCSCSCKGGCCTCICGDGIGCDCSCTLAPTVALPAGMSVDSAVAAISASVKLMPKIVILSGGDEVIPFALNTTPWQALARLASLTGVRLGVIPLSPQAAARNFVSSIPDGPPQVVPEQSKPAMREIGRMPLTRTLSLCVHEDAGLPVVLDKLSRATGYAFDVVGSPNAHFTLTAKGTLDDVLSQLSSAAGVSVTIAQ